MRSILFLTFICIFCSCRDKCRWVEPGPGIQYETPLYFKINDVQSVNYFSNPVNLDSFKIIEKGTAIPFLYNDTSGYISFKSNINSNIQTGVYNTEIRDTTILQYRYNDFDTLTYLVIQRPVEGGCGSDEYGVQQVFFNEKLILEYFGGSIYMTPQPRDGAVLTLQKK